jgi:hypothetical protein
MTADERLALIRPKIERAKLHVRDLNVALKSFFDTQPYKVGTNHNVEARQFSFNVTAISPVPSTIPSVASDVLQNLRSALDHLAYQLFIVNGGSGSGRHVYFPISDSATKYKAETPRKVQGLGQKAIKAIDAIEPYKGGNGDKNDTLWRLHTLNNIDKHRTLNVIVPRYRSFNVAPIGLRSLERILGQPLPKLDVFLEVSADDRLRPLQIGDELLTGIPDNEGNEKQEFGFEVAFGEPEVVESKSLLETLQHMADLVDNLVSSFKPLLI